MQLPLNDDVVDQFSAEMTAGSLLVSAAGGIGAGTKKYFRDFDFKKIYAWGPGGYGAWSRIN